MVKPCEVIVCGWSVLGALFMELLDTILEKVVKRSLSCIARPLVSLVPKLIGVIRSLPVEYWRRQKTIYPSNVVVEHRAGGESEREDRIGPCVERLEKLEEILEQLKKRPAEIPVEKEHMLHESLDRIKSVEFDLNKTKRVGGGFLFIAAYGFGF